MTRALRLTTDDATAYGCAEATLASLQHHFELPNPDDASAAMALNGGIAYSGGTCGALTGAALALGRLAASRVGDHSAAKTTTRRLIQDLMVEFVREFGATDCRSLTGFDLAAAHDAFLESGVWETRCMAQIRFVLDRIAPLSDPDRWRTDVDTLADAETAVDLDT